MQARPDATRAGRNPAERAHLTFWTLGSAADARLDGEVGPTAASIQDRVRRLPGACLLTAGYYAGRAPVLGDLLRRPR